MTKENLTEQLNDRLNVVNANINRWKAGFDNDPLYAFENSDATFGYAAEQTMILRVLKVLEKRDVQEIQEFLEEENQRYARYPLRTTCPTTALAKQHEAAARQTILDILSK